MPLYTAENAKQDQIICRATLRGELLILDHTLERIKYAAETISKINGIVSPTDLSSELISDLESLGYIVTLSNEKYQINWNQVKSTLSDKTEC